MPEHYRKTLVRQISQNPCRLNDTYGTGQGYLWVAKGCRAEFEVTVPGVAPANVIVQTVSVRGSKYVDVLGSRTPYTRTVGRGPAVLLRDGRLIRATWRRLTVKTGTRFLDDKRRDVPMKPGPTWILLQPKGESFSWSS